MGRRGRSRKQLLEDLNEKRGHQKLKEKERESTKMALCAELALGEARDMNDRNNINLLAPEFFF